MPLRIEVDREAIADAARSHSVRRLRVFGSAIGEGFDPARSDIDLLVEFDDGIDDPFDAYFGLKAELERVFARPVDLVMTGAIRNPHFTARVLREAEELYAA